MQPVMSCPPSSDLMRAPQRRRKGFTLAELILALTAIGGLSVLMMTVICLLTTAEQSGAESLFLDVTIANLASDLRRDAHRASNIDRQSDIDQQQPGEQRVTKIIFTQPDDVRVSYECTTESVIREERQADDVVGREEYRLAFGTSWFEGVDVDKMLTWRHERAAVTVGGYTPPSADQSPQRTYQVDAAVGLHGLLLGKETP